MQNDPDPFQLQRFIEAQEGTIEVALAELRAGRKRSHWMWFVFPQLAGLGRSPTAQLYGIRSLSEARAYLAHPLLGGRLREAVEAILACAPHREAVDILGGVDALKLQSSLTLFEAASGDPLFSQGLDVFFGARDKATQRLLSKL